MALDAEAKQEQCQKFVIWKELAAGKELLCSWPLCDLYFVNDSLFPGWLVLVPRVPNVREIFELSTEQQVLLIEEISKASKAVRELFCPDKLNVGALGNVVEQLHVHVVPRWRSDKAWPGPMWGAHPAQPFSPEELRKCLGKLHQHLGFEPLKDLETRIRFFVALLAATLIDISLHTRLETRAISEWQILIALQLGASFGTL